MGRICVVIAFAMLGCGRIAFDSSCEPDKPCVEAIQINQGATYARGPRVSVMVRVTGAQSPFDVRLAQTTGPCQDAYADDRWQPHAGSDFTQLVEPVDGTKKICAWARDASGAISTIAAEMRGINVDTIIYEAEQVPIVEAFEVTPIAGDRIRVSWTVSDAEGLADAPVDLEYTLEDVTRAMWMPLASQVGDASGTGSIELAAPTTQPYFVRIVPRDRAGNRGAAGVSDVLNVASWNVYLGTRDRGIGGAGHAAQLSVGSNTNHQFAVDPASLDVYASDEDHGVVRLDGATGVVERLLAIGPSNLPDDGPLPADGTVPRNTSIRFGPDGRLYLSPGNTGNNDTISTVIYQIDPVTRHCRRYLGGGTGTDGTATPATVFAYKWVFEFDEAGSIYFLTSCAPGTVTDAARMLKATQRPDGTAGTISVVAGNCAIGTLGPGGPYDAINSPLQGFQFKGIGTIVAWDGGRVVYYASYPGATWKIIDGQLYSAAPLTDSAGTVAYDATTDTLYAANLGVDAYRPNLAGPAGETLLATVAAANGSGDCSADGVPAAQACVSAAFAMHATRDRLYFLDGPRINESRTYRVRFVDAAGTVRTLLGSPALRAGLDRRVTRGSFAGIAYKPDTAPNQNAFPAGLYFVDPSAIVMGHVDPTSGRVSVLWGNQGNTPIHHATGAAIGPDVSLGVAYSGGNLQPLTLDEDGLPWLRYGAHDGQAQLVRLDATRTIVDVQNGGTRWETAADGTDPYDIELWPYGAVTNLTLRNDAAFLLGGYSTYNTIASIRMLEFAAGTTTRLMGATGNAISADRLTPGTVGAAGLWSGCMNGSANCYAVYRADQDRLYFSEDTRLRFITTPSTPATSTLQTLFTEASTQRIHNFTFSPDGSQVFYVSSSGQLRCHDLSSGAPWCNDLNLGPPLAVMSGIVPGANQLTWRDARTLLVSTNTGEVLSYTLP